MKTRTILFAILSVAVSTGTAFGAAGTISTSLSPAGAINLGDTITVTFSISGYTDATEIDGYNFHVAYPASLFSFVGGSLNLNDAAGANANWLRLAPQDGVGTGALPLSDFTATGSGTADISVADLRLSSTRGTTAAGGFLYSFSLTAIGFGPGSITPTAAAGGTVLFDPGLSPAGVPAFGAATVTVVAPRLDIARSGSNVLITWTQPGAILQRAPDVTGPWADLLTAASPYTNSVANLRMFYRLRIP